VDHLPDECREGRHGPFFWRELGAIEWSVILGLIEHHNLYWSSWDHPSELAETTLVMGRLDPTDEPPRFDLEDNLGDDGEVRVGRHDENVVTLCSGASISALEDLGLIAVYPVWDAQGQWVSVLTDVGLQLVYREGMFTDD
jgi:hypothetical protein